MQWIAMFSRSQLGNCCAHPVSSAHASVDTKLPTLRGVHWLAGKSSLYGNILQQAVEQGGGALHSH